MMQMYFTIKIF